MLGVLGAVARYNGFSIIKLIRYIKEELLLVLGTSSSESALPSLLEKMERAGCSKPVVGLVVPTGYSFNLDGTNIYMTMAALFIAQATDTPLSLRRAGPAAARRDAVARRARPASPARASSPWRRRWRWCPRCRWSAWR